MVSSLAMLVGCAATLPSERFERDLELPVPRSATSAPTAERLTEQGNGRSYTLNAWTLVPLAFDLQPGIKSSFQRFRSEQARYDFFYASRDSLTPKLTVSHGRSEDRELDSDGEKITTRYRNDAVSLSVEKRFFDTSRLDVGTGFRAGTEDSDTGDRPFVSASVRYPLWASRERLERTSEEIFRRNELNDTQLDYVRTIRNRLEQAMKKYYEVVYLGHQIDWLQQWLDDLNELATQVDQLTDRDTTTDRARLDAEITRVNALVRNQTGWCAVQTARLKELIGLPFHAHVELEEPPFNPFEGATHDQLLERSIQADPEIATLRNALRNAEVQYELARQGQWDIALRASGASDLEGGGRWDRESDWSLMVGLDVSAVDPRVTTSLMKQSQANIARFQEAIAARENAMFTATLEPLLRLDTLGESRDDTLASLPSYEQDYRAGLDEYVAGTLNIDDLLSRRNTLYGQQNNASNLTYLCGANVAELCTATGLFFEMLDAEAELPTLPEAPPLAEGETPPEMPEPS